MKAQDVRAKTPDELKEELAQLKREQFNLRFQQASGQLESTARVRQVRRDVARIKTIVAEKARGGEVAATGAAAAAKKPARKGGLLGRIRGKKNA